MYARKALSRSGSKYDRPKRRGNVIDRIAAAREQRADVIVSKTAKTEIADPKATPEITPEAPHETDVSSTDWLNDETGFPQTDLHTPETDVSGIKEEDPLHTELRNELREIMATDAQESANDVSEPSATVLREPKTRSPWMIYAAAALVLAAAAVLLYAPNGDLTWLSASIQNFLQMI